MTKFVCKSCNYNFEFEMQRLPKICPNCGDKDSVTKEKTAEELVEEAG